MFYVYLSYLQAFRKYANSLLNECSGFIEIGKYANLLTGKANQLITRAALNENIHLARLQKDLFESGGIYVQKFTAKFNGEKSGPKEQHDLIYKNNLENPNL